MNDRYKLYNDDCMKILKELPTTHDNLGGGHISLILTDPPYGTITGLKNTYAVWDETLPTQPLIRECERLLRMNGVMALFCQYPYSVELVQGQTTILPFLYWLYWIKDKAGNNLTSRSAPVNVVEQIAVYRKKYDSNFEHPLREYASRVYDYVGLSMKQIEERMGNRAAEHFFYRTDSSQFELCTADTYQRMIDLFGIDQMSGFKSYRECVDINAEFNAEFNIPKGQKQIKNILPYKKDKTNYHPTQKPIKLLETIIKTYTKPGDIVLDFTMGSGSTGVACMNTHRKFIGIEKNKQYYKIAESRIQI